MCSQSRLALAIGGSEEEDSHAGSAASFLTAKKKRRVHQKSRSGCRTCKRRKIKCDEDEPECTPCKRFGVPCDFLPSSEWEQRNLLYENRRKSGEKRTRGRPRRNRTTSPLVVSRSSSPQHRSLSRTVSQETPAQASSCLNVDDLLLLHHYITVAAATLGHQNIWTESVPKLGRHHPGVLHATLSISAFHLARTDLHHAPRLLTQAERHYEIAVRDATAMAANLTIDNCQAFYALAVLICFTSFARKPSPGNLMLVASDGGTSSLQLIRGVRVVIETFGDSVIYSGFLSAKEPEGDDECQHDPSEDEKIREHRRKRVEVAFPGWDWQSSLFRVAGQLPTPLVSAMDKVLDDTIAGMSRCYSSICRTRAPVPSSRERQDGDFISTMQWVYTFDELFIQALNERNKTALILVGHFGVLLDVLEGFWFLYGWGRHILRELRHMLGDQYEEYLPRVR